MLERLRRRDVTLDSVESRWTEEYVAALRDGVRRPSSPPAVVGGADATADRSIMSRLHLETEAVRREILRKAARVAPAYNKGALQYSDEDPRKVEDRE